MLKRNWALIALVYLALAEILSLAPVPDLSLCLIQPEHSEQPANHDDEKYCPAFHVAAALAIEKVDVFLENHDKSVVGGFTIVLAISTIGLWLATNKLWASGEKQFGLLAETSLRQSRDMKASVVAAEAAVNVAQDTAKRQLRAYVSVAGLARTKDPGEVAGAGFAVWVDVKNEGQTPAYDVFHWAKIDLREFPLNGGFDIHCIENPSRCILSSGDKNIAFPTFKRDLTPLEEQAILSNGKAVYVYGEIDYRDAFGKRHMTQFRFRCNGQGYPLGMFKADGEGNEAT